MKTKKQPTWGENKEGGLRKHINSGIWHINRQVNGKTLRVPGGGSSTKTSDYDAARVVLKTALNAATAGDADVQAAILKAGVTLADDLTEALRRASAATNPNTRVRKEHELKYLQQAWTARHKSDMNKVDPRLLKVSDILELQAELSSKYASAVANRLGRVFTGLLELAEVRVTSFRSPHRQKDFKPIKIIKNGKVKLPKDEVFMEILAGIRNEKTNVARHRAADLAEGLAYTGLRIEEARALRVEHVVLHGALPYLDLPLEIVKGKTHGRRVPLGERGSAAHVLFTRLVAEAGPSRQIFKANAINRALVRVLKTVSEKLNIVIPHFSHHTFRHWFATIALEKTGNAKQVAEWLGHRDGGKLVWALYSHAREGLNDKLAVKLDSNWSMPAVAAA